MAIGKFQYLRQNVYLSKYAFRYSKCTLEDSSFLQRDFGLLESKDCYKKIEKLLIFYGTSA